MRKGKRGQKVIPSASRGALNPKDRLRQQAYGLRNVRNFAQAKPLLEELHKLEPDNIPLALDLGEAYMETEDFASATSLYAKLIEKDPKNINAVTNLGGSLIRQGKLNDARSILEYALQLDPKSIHARINLGSVLQASGERKANLDNALEAVQIDPSSSLAFNNLGSAFSDMAMFKEARHAYETAVMLEPDQVDALINLAAVESRLGDSKASSEMYERVIKKLPKEAEQRLEATKFYAAFEYLKQGNLEKGWDYYEGGFSPLVPAKGARSPRREFNVPRWDGQPLNGKTLLVWREQGVGDELLFSTCLSDLQSSGGKIIVECDERLVAVFKRSFPSFLVRSDQAHYRNLSEGEDMDYDFHSPMGSLMKFFRNKKEDFINKGSYIIPNKQLVKRFKDSLAPYRATKRLIGICWRSGKLDPVRNLGYIDPLSLESLALSNSIKLVNLQYGDCENELCEFERKFNIDVVRWNDLDLKNDFESTFALISCLDAVVSVQTAVLVMAGVVGVPSIGVKAGGWTNFDNKTRSPWYQWNKRCHSVERISLDLMEIQICKLISYFLSNSKSLNQEVRLEKIISNLTSQERAQILEKILVTEGSCLRQSASYLIKLSLLSELSKYQYNKIKDYIYNELKQIENLPVQFDIEIKKNILKNFHISAAKNGDWNLVEKIFNTKFSFDQSFNEGLHPQIAWLSFLDGRLDVTKETLNKALDYPNPTYLARYNAPRLIAELGDYEGAVKLADELKDGGLGPRGLYTGIAEAAITDGRWEKALELITKQGVLTKLNGYEFTIMCILLSRVIGPKEMVKQVDVEFSSLIDKVSGVYSYVALANMQKHSCEEFYYLLSKDEGNNYLSTFRAKLIFQALYEDFNKIPNELKRLESIFGEKHNHYFYADLVLCANLRKNEEFKAIYLSALVNTQQGIYPLRDIQISLKTRGEPFTRKLIKDFYRGQTSFARNYFYVLNLLLVDQKTEMDLSWEDKSIRRNSELSWFHKV